MIKLNRRILLKGLGGAVVAAPFLPSLFEGTARAQSGASPTRLVIMWTHYGCITNRWFPTKSHGELTAADLTTTDGGEACTLAPLAAYYKKLLIPRGIRTMNEWTQNNRGAGKGRGQGNDSHTSPAGSSLTCQPVTPNSNDPFSFEDPKFNAKPIGPSLDHVIAKQISPNGTPLFLQTGGSKDSTQSAISYSAAETAFSPLNAKNAFSGITNMFKSGTPMNADTYAVVRGKSILDVVREDLLALERLKMSQKDKLKLAAWKELLNSVTPVLGGGGGTCTQDLATMLGATDANVGKVGGGGLGSSGDGITTKVTDKWDGADMYAVIAALYISCNANPMVLLKFPGNYTYKGLSINTESHSVSHRLSNANMSGPCLENAVASILKIDGYYAQKFANLVSILDGIPEGDGTVLDHSAAVWMNEMSDGNAHNHNNAPIIQAGSMGGHFKTGWIVNVETPGKADLNNGRSLSQCTGKGANEQSNGVNQGTGTEAQYANAPINKYFCNLMVGLGLKADAQGFPAKNGPASEVTHYGYADKTEDFCGGAGAVKEAGIHSPGEYKELTANS